VTEARTRYGEYAAAVRDLYQAGGDLLLAIMAYTMTKLWRHLTRLSCGNLEEPFEMPWNDRSGDAVQPLGLSFTIADILPATWNISDGFSIGLENVAIVISHVAVADGRFLQLSQ
jgi:hypothetical protein